MDIQYDDYVIGITGNLGTQYYCRQVGTYTEIEDILKAIKKDMEKEKFYSSIYFVNDHGNIDLIDYNGNIIESEA